MDLTLSLAKCMVEKDARMPRYDSHRWTGVQILCWLVCTHLHLIQIVSGISGLRYRASCLCYTLRSQTRRSTVSSSWSTASLYPTWTPRHPPQHWRYVWYRPFVLQLSTNIERIYWDWRSEWWWKLQSKNIWGVVETGESLGSDGEVKGEDWGMLEGLQR